MFVGPVFSREVVTNPRRPRHFMQRTIYATALFVLICTAWLVVTGTQLIRNVGDMALFGSSLFQYLSVLQLSLALFLSALLSASSVAQEKDRRTLILLLMTRMSNTELVLGKLSSSLLNVFVMVTAAAPLFMFNVLFGGVSFDQVGRVYLITFASVIAAGALGSTLAFWREKTFQTLAMTALALVMWLGVWEAVGSGQFGPFIGGVSCQTLAESLSPIRAVIAASKPATYDQSVFWMLRGETPLFLLASLGIAALLNLIAIARVRVWNPSREVRIGQTGNESQTSIWGARKESGDRTASSAADNQAEAAQAEAARAEHVDARVQKLSKPSRRVWDNPILWREVCTWAYGRKVLIIQFIYLLFLAMAVISLYALMSQGPAAQQSQTNSLAGVIPAAALPLAPFFFVSLVIVNALAVTSITNERDILAIDLLLVTDLSAKEFVFGKLFGVFWVTKEMIAAPMLICVWLWWRGEVTLENLIYLLGGLTVMNLFATMLGVHCGMIYSNSRTAIGASLGVVFFLFVGVITCMFMMISFSGSFQTQLAPFLAIILGGGVGLFASLGSRNPSSAIFTASLLLPFATFFAITSFLLGNRELEVFFVTAVVYGFTIAAMMIPAISEFDIAMGRTKNAGDE